MSFTAIEMSLAGFGLEALADVTHGGAWHIGVLAAPGIAEMLLAGREREFLGNFAFPAIIITVTGTVNGARDDFRIFGTESGVPQGTPYTLVFRFDDTKGQPMPAPCPGSGSGITGGGQLSPGSAVLTINGKSYEFGRCPPPRPCWR
jgi:hypothetical protein